jgi:hypothetical protein
LAVILPTASGGNGFGLSIFIYALSLRRGIQHLRHDAACLAVQHSLAFVLNL